MHGLVQKTEEAVRFLSRAVSGLVWCLTIAIEYAIMCYNKTKTCNENAEVAYQQNAECRRWLGMRAF